MRVVSLFALAGLGLSSTAHADDPSAVTVALTSGECGGDITVTVDGTSSYRMVVGAHVDGHYPVDRGVCAGLATIDIDGEVTAPMTRDSVTFALPMGYCGTSLQVMSLDVGSECATSNVLELPRNIDAYDLGYEAGCVYGGGTWDTTDGTCVSAVCDETTNDASIEQALCESAAVGGTWDASDGSCTAATCLYSDTDDDDYDDASYAAGYSAAPAGSTYCGADTTWDGDSCVSSVAAPESGACLSSELAREAGMRVVEVFANDDAFAALYTDGSVSTWGRHSTGGDSSDVDFTGGVATIVSSQRAFAALKNDGTVVTWGSSYFGGDSSAVASELTNVATLYSSAYAFVAHKTDGSVVTWGDASLGGDSSGVDFSGGVQTFVGNHAAFAALKEDGSVVTWGDATEGGSTADVDLSGVVTAIASTNYAFAALKEDGSVVTWGRSTQGGNSDGVDLSSGVTTVVGNVYAFAAIKDDGSVVTWGGDTEYCNRKVQACGGDSSGVDFSGGVHSIVGSDAAFVARKTDGSVVAWGHEWHGSDIGAVAESLVDFQTMVGNHDAFASIAADGSVVTWGVEWAGGDPGNANLTGVETIVGGRQSFAALKSDGSVVTWGLAPENYMYMDEYYEGMSWGNINLLGVPDALWSVYPTEVGGPCTGDSTTSPDSYCGDGTTWDAAAGTCTAAAAGESPQCFLSGVCSFYGKEAPYGHVDSEGAFGVSLSCSDDFDLGQDWAIWGVETIAYMNLCE